MARRPRGRGGTWRASTSSASHPRRPCASARFSKGSGDGGRVRTRPLTEVTGRELRPLLEEESAHWQGELFWDYSDVSHAVQSGVDRHALTGFVLQDGLRT